MTHQVSEQFLKRRNKKRWWVNIPFFIFIILSFSLLPMYTPPTQWTEAMLTEIQQNHHDKPKLETLLLAATKVDNCPVTVYCELAMLYEEEKKFKDIAKAKEWYQVAADKGDAQSQTNLACLWMPTNPKKAYKLFRKAAKQGYPTACGNLGLMYLRGKYVDANEEKAKKWLGKAVHGGCLEIEFIQGFTYCEGELY